MLKQLAPHWRTCAALCLLLAGAWTAFAPGITGGFAFDDFPNLSDLRRAQEGDLAGVGQYVFDGVTGFPGRPLSLASFALQAHSWSGHPEDFIRFNILLHLLNGTVLCWVLLRLLRLASVEPGRAEALAVAAMGVWLVAAPQAGAVLYVVQRMAALSGSCMLVGLLLYLVGRERIQRGQAVPGLVMMTAGTGIGLLLGILAKENAIVFPLLVLVAEFTLLQPLPRPRVWRNWALACLGVPLALFATYLLWRLPTDLQSTTQLGFTSPERVLSQPRVLLLYLKGAALPSLYGLRIYYDDLAASISLFKPGTTLPALLACIAFLVVALTRRRQWPLVSFAILWFFAAHSLESSFIPLELAFDHRNYVALAGPALLLVAGADALLRRPEILRIRPFVVAALGAYFLFLGVAQWHTAALWAQPYELMKFWAHTQPDSRRIRYELADAHFRNGHPLAALRERERALVRWPGDTSNVLAILGIGCVLERAPMPGLTVVEHSLSRYDGHATSTLGGFNRIILQIEAGICTRYSLDFLLTVLDRIFELPDMRARRFAYHAFRARLYQVAGNTGKALDELEAAIAIRPSLATYEAAINWALDAGDLPRARRLFDTAERGTVDHELLRRSYAGILDDLRERLDSTAPAERGLESR